MQNLSIFSFRRCEEPAVRLPGRLHAPRGHQPAQGRDNHTWEACLFVLKHFTPLCHIKADGHILWKIFWKWGELGMWNSPSTLRIWCPCFDIHRKLTFQVHFPVSLPLLSRFLAAFLSSIHYLRVLFHAIADFLSTLDSPSSFPFFSVCRLYIVKFMC